MSIRSDKPLTASDLYHYFQCPHWPYWDRYGNPADRREQTESEIRRNEEGLEHETQTVSSLFSSMQEVKTRNVIDGVEATLELMKQGVPVIYQGWLSDAEHNWLGRPDLLERHEGKSALGDWYYIPLDIKRAHELRKEHKAQLTFYATLLERIQKRFPTHPAIINADRDRLEFDASEFVSEFNELIEKMDRLRDGECPDPVYRKACQDVSPWGAACYRLAKEQDDIALLYNVDVRKLEALRANHIRTVADAAELIPEQLEGCAPGMTLRALQSIQRQALSLKERLVIIRRPFDHETVGLEIHFDIESHPPTDRDYLFGFWIGPIKTGEYKDFTADAPEQEEQLWKSFLSWLETLPAEYTVYHYSPYEVTRLQLLGRRYGDEENPWLQKFIANMVDLKRLTSDTVVFPLYFYSLKAIGKFLGFAWEGDVKGGGESVAAFEQWLETGDRQILNAIIQYNREDVQATAFLLDWLHQYARTEQAYGQPYPWTAENASV